MISANDRVDDQHIYMGRDLAAKKNREQLDSRVYKSGIRRKMQGKDAAAFSNINSSKESEDFMD